MTFTTDYKQALIERLQREPAFAAVLFDEAILELRKGEAASSRALLEILMHTPFFEMTSLNAAGIKTSHHTTTSS